MSARKVLIAFTNLRAHKERLPAPLPENAASFDPSLRPRHLHKLPHHHLRQIEKEIIDKVTDDYRRHHEGDPDERRGDDLQGRQRPEAQRAMWICSTGKASRRSSIISDDSQVIASSNPGKNRHRESPKISQTGRRGKKDLIITARIGEESKRKDQRLYNVIMPVSIKGQNLGYIHISMILDDYSPCREGTTSRGYSAPFSPSASASSCRSSSPTSTPTPSRRSPRRARR